MKRYLVTDLENGTETKIPLSDNEYNSIKWDWMKHREELVENYLSIVNTRHWVREIHDMSYGNKEFDSSKWDEQVATAKKALDDFNEKMQGS